MVNGPRPTSIQKPSNGTPRAATGMLTAAVSPAASTPTILQRQATSVYSVVTSTGTPVLVYGKQATPLAGAWSAEPWSPSQMRKVPFTEELSDPVQQPTTLENLLDHENDDAHVAHFEDYLNDAATTERETASVADTAQFVDHRADLELGSPVHASGGDEPCRHNGLRAAVSSASTAQSHVAHRYRNDPYSVYGQRELYRCTCDDCMASAVTGRDPLADFTDELSSGMYPTESYAATAAAANYDEYDEQAPAAQDQGLYWGPSRTSEAAPTTIFMPPPPPPRITRRVIRESAEPGLDVDMAFYHLALRWYNKVAQVQDRFVPEEDLCPEPGSADQSFDDWTDAVGRWWLRNFEHLQVKPATASAGLLRSSYTAARAVKTAAPFSTHANTASTTVRHPALRQEPRRQFGSSGLTADMLTRHNANAGLPTPRSLEQRRRDDLPW